MLGFGNSLLRQGHNLEQQGHCVLMVYNILKECWVSGDNNVCTVFCSYDCFDFSAAS